MDILKKNQNFVNNVLALGNEFQLVSSDELKNKFQGLRLANLDDFQVIQNAFAITREMSFRTLGLKHFPTQILGGLFLHKGKIVEMKTGEGKTLVGTLPASLNSLSGCGVHIVTVNEYLARRDSTWMGKLYKSLGLTTGLIEESLSSSLRRKNYLSDITYVTNTDVGFDFLRDNCVSNKNQTVLRPFNYCIIDEVDSVLIDEARTPLVLGQSESLQISKYQEAEVLASCLVVSEDFLVDYKLSQITLTDSGIFKLQTILGIKNLFDKKDPWIPFIINALKANYIFQRNKDYVVLGNKVCIVDEFTGRIMEDRRWNGGLHQAIEVKENVSVQPETQTVASITYQNFFTRYSKISGMTGTAESSQKEFKSIYGLETIVLPTAKALQRQDLPDRVYNNEFSKWKSVASECVLNYQKGRPVLVGTTSVKNSEILSEILMKFQIPHKVLNARPENVKQEAEIVAQAGRLYSITIATNMAGRGTDIILGGNLKFLVMNEILQLFESYNFGSNENPLIEEKLQYCYELFMQNYFAVEELYKEISLLPDTNHSILSNILLPIYHSIYPQVKAKWELENSMVKELGGLYVIGTERHESARIDNQLRGRAGRQGDPGTSCFFLSLGDDLLKNFGGDQIKNLLERLNISDDEPLESSFLTQSVNRAQSKVESFYFESRKKLFEYDEVLNLQRDSFIIERQRVLSCFMWNLSLQYLEKSILSLFLENKIVSVQSIFFPTLDCLEKQNLIQLVLGIDCSFIKSFWDGNDNIINWFLEQTWITSELNLLLINTYDSKDMQKQYLRENVLIIYDQVWMSHLEKIEVLKDSVGWKGYEQRNPLLRYKDDSYFFYQKMLQELEYQFISKMLFYPYTV